MTATHQPSVIFPTFTTDITGLADATAPAVIELHDGSHFDLRIAPVVKQLGDDRVRMLAYNGSIPGPTLRVRQGSEISVHVRNDSDLEATVHWHGLRLENQYDGSHDTQEPIGIGGEFTYHVRFPDPGVYWYHPHIREDYGLDMGLYGSIVVEPNDPDYWPVVDREFVVTLDDVLIEDGRITPYRLDGPTFVAMGRFGNVMLTRGETDLTLGARAGEVVRFYFTNTANTRLFNVSIPGARMKPIAGDSGRYEHETFVDAILLSPSERAVVDVLFESAGSFTIANRTPMRTYALGTVTVTEADKHRSNRDDFELLRSSMELIAERVHIEPDRLRPPDKTLAFESLMPLLYGSEHEGATAWTCPMHPEIASDHPSKCPLCGMKLVPASAPAMPEGHHEHDHDHGTPDGLEWEDLMPEINRASDGSNMFWKLVDRDTGMENGAIDWVFRVGDRVKIRLVNDLDQDHPMHHPFHVHGAGRFLVLSRDGSPDANLVWKDTVLVRAGETVDILLDVSNPGRWMAHCHIAEHNQSGMMFSFTVTDDEL